jgi:hypothetical protein
MNALAKNANENLLTLMKPAIAILFFGAFCFSQAALATDSDPNRIPTNTSHCPTCKNQFVKPPQKSSLKLSAPRSSSIQQQQQR